MPTGWTDLPLELRSRILDISLNSVVKDALTNAWMNHVTELQSKRITEEDLSWLGYVSHSFGMDSLPILDEIHKHLVTEHGNFEGKCRVEDMKSQNKRGETTHVPSDDICRFAVVCGYKRAVEEVLKIIESRNVSLQL